MPSGAHTPISFIKGGGSAVFSANCVSLLSEVGFSPDDFGTHNALSERQRALRARAQRVLGLSRENQERHGGPLTQAAAARRDTAQRQSDVEIAHLGQNGAKQRERGNPCSNMVDGHDDGEYPCVRLGGPAFGRGGVIDPNTEHGAQSANEVTQARADGRTPDTSQRGETRKDARPPTDGSDGTAKSTYPADQMAADERARCSGVCSERAARTGTTGALDAGAMPDQPSQKQRNSLEAYNQALENRDAQADGSTTEIDGETAAECMDTFHQMGVAAMNQKCQESVADNQRRAGTPEQRQQARKAAEAAEARAAAQSPEARAAQEELKTANRQAGQLNSPHNSRSRKPPDDPDHKQWKEDVATSNRRVADAQAACRSADEGGAGAVADQQRAAQEAANLRRRSSAMDNAHCRARQGLRVGTPQARTDGRVPGGRPPPSTEDRGQTDQGFVDND